jgi:hypothetical protein
MLLSHQQPTNSPKPPRESINQLSRVTTQKAYLAYWNRLELFPVLRSLPFQFEPNPKAQQSAFIDGTTESFHPEELTSLIFKHGLDVDFWTIVCQYTLFIISRATVTLLPYLISQVPKCRSEVNLE